MIRCFRKSLALYTINSIVAFVLAGLFFFPRGWTYAGNLVYTSGFGFFKHSTENFSILNWVFMLLILWLPGYIFSVRLARKAYKEISDILFERCDPIEFLKRQEPWLKRSKRNRSLNITFLSQRTIALSALGDTAAAIALTENLISAPLKPKHEIRRAIFYINLCTYYSKNAYDLEQAKLALARAKGVLLSHRGTAFFSACRFSLYKAQNTLMVYEGNYSKALDFFINTLPLTEDRYEEISTHYTLAIICEKLSDTAQQMEHLKYVANNGNTMCIAAEAREKLAALNAQI